MPTSRARKNDGHYFVVVDGVPQYCQWQELKDYLRESAKVKPGHTEVVKVNDDGTRMGYCPLPTKAEANRAFEYLVAEGWRGFDIRVSLVWKSDPSSQDIERRRGPEPSRRRRLPVTTPLLPFPSVASHQRQPPTTTSYETSSINPTLQTLSYSTNKTHSTVASMLPSYLQYNPKAEHNVPQSILSGLAMDQYHSQMIGNHRHNSSWYQFPDLRYTNQVPGSSVPVERDGQSSNTDSRCIQISRLPLETKREDLRNFLQRFGPLSALDLRTTTEQRRFAVVKFQSASQASLAIQELDGEWWRNRRLVVQHARSVANSIRSDLSSSKGSDSDSSRGQGVSGNSNGRSGPLVVNGARGPVYHKRRKRDDDSESLQDASSADERWSCNSKVTTSHSTTANPRKQTGK